MIILMKKIYLDYASLTPIDKRVMKEMAKYSTRDYGNPSALYASAVASKKALLDARKRIATVLHGHADEIFFTASGTEANNIVLRSVSPGKHIIVSAVEHSSVIETCRALEKKGIRVTYITVDKNGLVNLDELKKAITPETALISVMMVNNEIGTIEPMQEIAKIVRDARKKYLNQIFFHTDACQASLLPLHLEKLGVDMITLDGHKMYGPRGVGVLYVKRGIKLEPQTTGGGQEKGLRSGTENIPGIVGFALALEIADKMREKEVARLGDLKSFFVTELAKKMPGLKINGDLALTSPHILNISISGIDNEFFVLKLDAKGIECSTKSACLKDEDESYVLRAIGADSATSIRFSFGRETTKSDLKKVLKNCIL